MYTSPCRIALLRPPPSLPAFLVSTHLGGERHNIWTPQLRNLSIHDQITDHTSDVFQFSIKCKLSSLKRKKKYRPCCKLMEPYHIYSKKRHGTYYVIQRLMQRLFEGGAFSRGALKFNRVWFFTTTHYFFNNSGQNRSFFCIKKKTMVTSVITQTKASMSPFLPYCSYVGR